MGLGLFVLATEAWIFSSVGAATRIPANERTALQFVSVLVVPVGIASIMLGSNRIQNRYPWIPWLLISLSGLALSSFYVSWSIAQGVVLSPLWVLPLIALFGVFAYIMLDYVIVEFLQERHFRKYPEGFIPPRLPALRLLRRRRLVRFEEIEEAGYVEGEGPKEVYLRLHDGTVLFLSEKRGIPVDFMEELVRKHGAGSSTTSRASG